MYFISLTSSGKEQLILTNLLSTTSFILKEHLVFSMISSEYFTSKIISISSSVNKVISLIKILFIILNFLLL